METVPCTVCDGILSFFFFSHDVFVGSGAEYLGPGEGRRGAAALTQTVGGAGVAGDFRRGVGSPGQG